MAVNSVANPNKVPPYFLPYDLVNEGHRLVLQSRAVLECLGDGIAHLDDPERCVPEIVWLVRDQLARLDAILETRDENGEPKHGH